MKIAVWSGPRNLSTAMLYSFGNRADFAVWDEPFYAAYLAATGIDHPMRERVIASGETDPTRVSADICGPVPEGKAHWYMKHMGFHMLDGFPLEWAQSCVNIHLIRHPARVVASYTAKRENPTLRDIGYEMQVELYDQFPGPVLDSDDIRRDPEHVLRGLCNIIGLSFDQAMLSWPVGPKPFDGVWASHWYGAVHRSAGFSGAEGPLPDLTGEQAHLAQAALPLYKILEAEKLS